jgi:hypothetical protein
MFAVLHSDINSLKSGLVHLTGQPYCKKGRSAKVKGGIINSILRNYLVDQYKYNSIKLARLSLPVSSILQASFLQNSVYNGATTLSKMAFSIMTISITIK